MSVTPIALHRAVAVGAFRWTVFFFVAIAAFAQRDEKTGTILATLVFLIDVVSWTVGELIVTINAASSNQQWHSTLTDRLIFEKLLDRFRDREHIDFSQITQEGTRAATEDVNKYMRDTTFWSEWGGFRKTLLGIGYYLWFWISYGMFYGAAGLIGSSMRGTYGY
ncbi:hypothetical protein EDE08_103473 [Bradyrhizobium sp. R2.2-H]|jgi:hypothetical protein|uniref:hypothetical protein n=1 Tax=unclassified Bradyrhizobium TaxID=2631580 RepID=UPI0010D6A714|nr:MULTISPECIES: hypothetical protein [unclassified Bradyrhizobium]TCU75253.1 hypothetical protein EDE10_103472 [Bradyrhizobium sp. Y-H1]TCU78021.1 hypothetical protein EDE08_103473 [Bradyrhizobium sp. R2.2-H]